MRKFLLIGAHAFLCGMACSQTLTDRSSRFGTNSPSVYDKKVRVYGLSYKFTNEAHLGLDSSILYLIDVDKIDSSRKQNENILMIDENTQLELLVYSVDYVTSRKRNSVQVFTNKQ